MSRRLAAALVATATAAGLQAQQQPPRFADRVDVSNIVVDVHVIDEQGAPVRGLLASDFFVSIGGKPARVVRAIWTGEAPAPAAAAPLDSRSAAITVAEPGQLVVLLFQKSLVNERARGLIRVVEQSRTMIRELPASDRIAILSFDTSLKIWSDFTSDREALDRILERGILHERPPSSVEPGKPSLLDALKPKAKKIGTMERALAAIGEALGPLPGSKAIAYVGYGFGAPPFGTRQDLGTAVHARFGMLNEDLAKHADMNNDYGRARRALTDARVSVFSLDITQADTHTFAAGMQVIARDTGGFYAASLDFPEKPMKFVTGALNGHYVLFVEPPDDVTERTLDVALTSDRRAYVYSTSSFKSAGQNPR